MNIVLKVVHVAAELFPLAKVGGLGEATYGILHTSNPKIQATIILPYYPWIDTKQLSSLKKELEFTVTIGIRTIPVIAFKGTLENFTVILLKEDIYFNRDRVYGFQDDPERFLFLSKAVIEFLSFVKESIDILHLHDWHAASCLPFLKESYSNCNIKKSVLSIHNLCYQGQVSKKTVEDFGLQSTLTYLEDEHQSEVSNLLKGGIELADLIIAVSPAYAKEILQKENSFGLYHTLNTHKSKIIGILNGIDTSIWSPEKDPLLKTSYHSKLPVSKVRKAKQENKRALFEMLDLKEANKPLVSYIGRLSEQKGLKLIEHAIKSSKKFGYQFVLLGSSTEENITLQFQKLKETCSNENVQLYLGFNEKLAHLIYASSDFIVIPSVFEPCGLVQIISFHYGSIPIGRKTGGLKDTIRDQSQKEGNGYLFEEYNIKSFDECLERALANYSTEKQNILIQNALKQNYCWTLRIDDYITAYKNLLGE